MNQTGDYFIPEKKAKQKGHNLWITYLKFDNIQVDELPHAQQAWVTVVIIES